MNIGGGPGQPSVWAWGCEKNGTLHRPSARRVFAAFEQAISHGSSASVSYIDFRLDPHRAQGGVSIAEAAGRDRRRRRANDLP